jgi:hypothetical protein
MRAVPITEVLASVTHSMDFGTLATGGRGHGQRTSMALASLRSASDAVLWTADAIDMIAMDGSMP